MKKIHKDYVVGIGVVIVIAALVIGGTSIRNVRARNQEATFIADMSNSKSPQTIDDLRKTIAAYEKQLDQFLKSASKTATYWKILATRLQDKGQHGEALEALKNAITNAPEDAALYYMTGISAAVMAKADVGFPGVDQMAAGKEAYYALAEQSYLRAIELKPDYDRPLYAIGILYVFELDRSGDAIPYLERYIDLNNRNPEGTADGLFVLARASYTAGEDRKAVDCYDRIISTSKNKEKLAQAGILRQQVLGMNG
jgi:tetratricopeptide (TPR) repeat protein